MGFLDNLENSLKTLETADERDPSAFERRERERAHAAAIAPWGEKLKASDFPKQLCDKAVAAGHKLRAKVYMAWFDSTLRLEARGKRLEIAPTAQGILANFETLDGQHKTKPVDLDSDPQTLVEEWLS